MTSPLPPDSTPPEPPEPPSKLPSRPRTTHRWRSRLLKVGAGFGGLIALTGVGVVIWGDRILTAKVLPRIEAEIEEIIERPFELGDVEGLSFVGVRLGTSTMPATETDESFAIVDAVEVEIDVRSLLFEQTLRPKIVLVRPEVLLAQSESGEWLELGLPEPSEEEGPISLEIQTIEVQEATLSASVYEQDNEAVVLAEPIEFTKTDVLVEFYGEDSEQVSVDLSGRVKEGRFDIKAEANLDERAGKAAVRSQNIPATAFNLLLPEGVGIRAGELESNLNITAALTEDNELDQSVTEVRGTARLRGGEVLLSQLTTPVENISSQLLFKGQQVTIEDTDLQVGDVFLVAAGDVDLEEGYDLTATVPSVTIADVQTLAEVDLPVAASGEFQLVTQVTGEIESPRVRGRLSNLRPLRVDKLGFSTAAADFILTPERLDLTRLRLNPQEGGTILADGQIDLDNLDNPSFQLRAEADLPADSLAQTYDVSIPEKISIGTVAAEVSAAGTLQDPSAVASWQLTNGTFPGRGELAIADNVALLENARFQVADGTLDAEGLLRLSEGTWQGSAVAQQISVDTFAQDYGIVLPDEIASQVVVGQLAAVADASGNLDAPVESIVAFADWQLSDSTFPGGGNIALANSVVDVRNTRLQVANGTVDAEATLQLVSGDWQANVITSQVPVEQFTAQAEGLLSADVDAAGNLGAINLEQIQAGGTAAIANAQIYLPKTGEALIERGLWTTDFQWQGDYLAVNSFSAPGVQANGTIGVDFAQSIPVDGFDLEVALQTFDLSPLNSFAPPAVAEYAQVAGLTSFDGQLTGTLNNPKINGAAQLENFAVNDLLFEPLSGPIAFSLANGGDVALQGSEDLIQLSVSEDAWPTTFEVRNQEFIAKGYGEGRRLHADILQLPLARLNIQPPASSRLRSTFGTLTGLLTASVDANLADFTNPAIEADVTVEQPALNPVEAKLLTASVAYENRTATIEQSELLFDDSRYLFTGQANLASEISYAGELTVAEGQIEDLTSVVDKLDLSAFSPGLEPTPFGSAADLQTQSVGLIAAGLLERLENFTAFVDAQPEEDAESGTLIVPPLEDLAGEFSGVIEVAGISTALEDLSASFNLQGDSWTWGSYSPPNEFALVGEVENMSLALETAVINAGETAINLSATGDISQLDGELIVDNLPVEVAGAIYPLPVDVAGALDVNATFDGSLANPVVVGEAAIANAQVNEYAVDQVDASFRYRDAQLGFESEVAIAPNDTPITASGNLLYALPFMSVQPPTQQIVANVVVPGDSFDVVNALTDNAVRWEGGTGEIVVQVGGTLPAPVVAGRASFTDGTVSSSLLEDTLTNLNGNIQFDLAQVQIQQLQANMGEGQLAVAGQLPLLSSGQSILAQRATPIAFTKQRSEDAETLADGIVISLVELPVDYDGLLEADFQGRVFITGAVLEPTVSGGVEISNGEVQANQLLTQAGSLSLPTEETLEEISPYRADYLNLEVTDLAQAQQPQGLLDRVTIDNFKVTFGDRLAIVGQPFYNLSAIGSLAVNGPLSDLRPDGTIELKSGWINLFSTQFRLASSAPNTATFIPENGLNPYVDVVMEARVQNRDITPAPRRAGGFVSPEVEVASGVETVGSVEYVEVQAIAQGPATELSDNLYLTSNSSLGEGELLALLGNSAFTGLTTASYTQFAGFFGAGSLATFGDNIADAIGLRSFSVFPTTDTSPDSSVGFGLGLQATAGISDRIEVNVLEILGSSSPPQLGLQYRITDELDLRGSSNLDDTDFILEYKISF